MNNAPGTTEQNFWWVEMDVKERESRTETDGYIHNISNYWRNVVFLWIILHQQKYLALEKTEETHSLENYLTKLWDSSRPVSHLAADLPVFTGLPLCQSIPTFLFVPSSFQWLPDVNPALSFCLSPKPPVASDLNQSIYNWFFMGHFLRLHLWAQTANISRSIYYEKYFLWKRQKGQTE